ncbi:MAG: hypothetical protein E7664_05110, partial [Ruminococcaceae bacterium]|nr:hypothetical protein [Oscillospiraceae bacterium]
MNTSKQQRTEQLLDAIGTLEDGILASALALTKKKSRRSVIGISASVAACLVACILIAAVIRMRPTPLPEDTATPATLSEVLRGRCGSILGERRGAHANNGYCH